MSIRTSAQILFFLIGLMVWAIGPLALAEMFIGVSSGLGLSSFFSPERE